MTALAAWQNFYVIVGSSAGALIGLQFVVMSLITGTPGVRTNPAAGTAFATPTIVHFCAVLGLAGLVCVPWSVAAAAAVPWGVLGIGGAVYTVVVGRRMRTQKSYRPVLEDWLFHALLPMAAYLMLAGSAWVALFRLPEALYAAGAAAMLLLFSGIHNAWDAVTYHVFVRAGESGREP
jgi:hypothetical protein